MMLPPCVGMVINSYLAAQHIPFAQKIVLNALEGGSRTGELRLYRSLHLLDTIPYRCKRGIMLTGNVMIHASLSCSGMPSSPE